MSNDKLDDNIVSKSTLKGPNAYQVPRVTPFNNNKIMALNTSPIKSNNQFVENQDNLCVLYDSIASHSSFTGECECCTYISYKE